MAVKKGWLGRPAENKAALHAGSLLPLSLEADDLARDPAPSRLDFFL